MKRSSRNRLNERHLDLFPGTTLFDKIARTVCRAGCLPRKELYESWEVARRIRRRFSSRRILDLACGHGLLAQIMILLDNSVPGALAVDKSIPASAGRLAEVMQETWPRLENRVRFIESELADVTIESNDLLVSVHGCGALSDRIIDMAITANVPVVLLPCCHDLKRSDTGNLEGWLEPTLAVDVIRGAKLQAAGYNVFTQLIPGDITEKNRLLMASPC
jgi:hypothetical protein